MKAEVLFPEVGNLSGDLMNIRYLKQCCNALEIVETDLKSRPAFLDEEVALAAKFGIVSIPTLVVMENGKPVNTAVGYRPKADILALLK